MTSSPRSTANTWAPPLPHRHTPACIIFIILYSLMSSLCEDRRCSFRYRTSLHLSLGFQLTLLMLCPLTALPTCTHNSIHLSNTTPPSGLDPSLFRSHYGPSHLHLCSLLGVPLKLKLGDLQFNNKYGLPYFLKLHFYVQESSLLNQMIRPRRIETAFYIVN